jgi:hypothetical protein
LLEKITKPPEHDVKTSPTCSCHCLLFQRHALLIWRQNSTLTHLFRPWSLNELWIDHLLPSLLALDVGAERKVAGDNFPVVTVRLDQKLQLLVLKGKQKIGRLLWHKFEILSRIIYYLFLGPPCFAHWLFAGARAISEPRCRCTLF